MYTPKQIAALKYLIAEAKHAPDLTKKILWFLIHNSSRLQRSVCLTLQEDREGYSGKEIHEAAVRQDGMVSSNGTTHLNEICKAIGSPLVFSCHYGDFDPTRKDRPFNSDGIFAGAPAASVAHQPSLAREGMRMRYTFWLAKKHYSLKAHLVTTTRGSLDEINLKKPGLYPSLEKYE